MDFAKINTLSEPLKEVIFDELAEINFEKESNKTCHP